MQQWEYYTESVRASVDNEGWEKYKHVKWPNWLPSRFSAAPAETLIPQLNTRGEEGWELVHMEPTGDSYFCAWKRPKQEAIEDEQEMKSE